MANSIYSQLGGAQKRLGEAENVKKTAVMFFFKSVHGVSSSGLPPLPVSLKPPPGPRKPRPRPSSHRLDFEGVNSKKSKVDRFYET